MAVNGAYISKESDVDIAVRCPVCGDSKSNKRKTRLHLYTKPGADTDFVHCFNGDCPVENKTVYTFLRDFYPNLLEQYKRETFGTRMENLKDGISEDVFQNIKQKTEVETFDLSPYMHKIESSEEALQYVKNRGYEYDGKFGQWYYGYQDLIIDGVNYPISDSLIIPLYCKNEMYGFYSRKIKEKKFCTYMNDVNIGFKIWNWFNVDKSKPVYIFEGIFDAISSGMTNVIAAIGAKIPDERIKELSQPVFVLDNDRTGLKNSLSYASKGYSVYVQPTDIEGKDMNEVKLNNNLDTKELIQQNIYSAIAAEIRIKSRL
jgi:hypothetical protein